MNRSIYDARASTYDTESGPEGFHLRQATDFLTWASPSPGSSILDLACGTGTVTLGLGRLAGPSGDVFGVDVSSASLEIAARKAEREGLNNVKFVGGDVTDVASQWAEEAGIKQEMFDIITCASAFILVENQPAVVNTWAKLLKKGGKLIFDVPTGDSMLKGLALERVSARLGIFNSHLLRNVDSEEEIKLSLTGAGLDGSGFFISPNYADGETYDVEKAGEIFDQMVIERKWFRGWLDELQKPQVKEKAQMLFCEELRNWLVEKEKLGPI